MNGLSTIVFKSLGVLFLVLLNGFFVAAELALVKIRDTQVSTLAEKGDKRARLVRLLISNLDSTISATQLGITLASLGLGIMVEPVFNAILDPVFNLLHVHSDSVRHTTALLTGFLVNCFLLIVVGELTPKAIAIRQNASSGPLDGKTTVMVRLAGAPFCLVDESFSLMAVASVGNGCRLRFGTTLLGR